MSTRVALEHRTVYRYDRPVRLGPQVVRLRPAPHCRTPILSYSLTVTPKDHFVNWQQDPAGNHLARLVFPEPTQELAVTVDIVADLTVINPFDFFVEDSAKHWPFTYDPALEQELAPYLATDPADADAPLLRAWVDGVSRERITTIDLLVALNRRIRDDVDYSVRMEPGVQPPEVTLTRAIGSCRDSAWLLVTVLRHLGIAARFASGYLVQLASDRPSLTGPVGPKEDFTDLHAWAEAYVPGAGWVGLDATSGLLAGEGHIPLACGAQPAAAAPISGGVEPAGVTLEHANRVTRLTSRAQVTKPYTDEQWARIDALGHEVDAALAAGDVRLTMGGEPTYVAARDQEADEWNTAADGPTKHGLAVQYALRLAAHFAPGALIRHGQGKWYPGEPLPRWQIGIHSRVDGEPLWNDGALLADPTQPGTATPADAQALALALAAGFGLAADLVVPAYEDRVAALLHEARLPGGEPPALAGPDPDDPRLIAARQRAALVAALDAETGEPTGWALPLHRSVGAPTWRTGRWHLRRRHLFLVPGDSPLGLRLPLDALTWTADDTDPDVSHFAPRAPFTAGPVGAPAPVVEDERPPRTALCVEVRGGHLRVYLPPLADAAHAVELIAVIERAVASVGVPTVIEGYAPPADPRLQSFDVTPDPGVIEVNIHPSSGWPQLVGRTEILDEEARRMGLSSEKFALDGTHTGTGGGSHLTLGGRTPRDSPFLRRPDLLRSLVTYWQHHPSLSYLFSGRFVGPTSQAPRVDEGRHEALYELEIAFAELDRLAAEAGGAPPPAWEVDRLLRNLLIDVTGNTHRAEFCVDKLYAPGSERGRLGVVELRGFEMAPHPRMALLQALLVRALVARCWDEPYRGDLVRWGTDLHDRFLLPWYARADIVDVLRDLRAHGFAFEDAWLDPFLEFRFPLLGEVVVDDVRLELRMAIEPWNVLGEEDGAGTARYVDSSVERLQVRVDDLTPGRHAVLCNGAAVPLRATATPGTFVAGVRYRAWQPWSALHPTIAVHTPLVFDLVDLRVGRSVGGCTYHVVHPGGRSYSTFPVNAAEAQARRASRFEAAGHTPGPVTVRPVDRDGEYPRTLDLRRVARS